MGGSVCRWTRMNGVYLEKYQHACEWHKILCGINLRGKAIGCGEKDWWPVRTNREKIHHIYQYLPQARDGCDCTSYRNTKWVKWLVLLIPVMLWWQISIFRSGSSQKKIVINRKHKVKYVVRFTFWRLSCVYFDFKDLCPFLKNICFHLRFFTNAFANENKALHHDWAEKYDQICLDAPPLDSYVPPEILPAMSLVFSRGA